MLCMKEKEKVACFFLMEKDLKFLAPYVGKVNEIFVTLNTLSDDELKSKDRFESLPIGLLQR